MLRAGDYDEAEISTSTRRDYAGRSDAEGRHQGRSRKTRVRRRRAGPDQVHGWPFGPEVQGSQVTPDAVEPPPQPLRAAASFTRASIIGAHLPVFAQFADHRLRRSTASTLMLRLDWPRSCSSTGNFTGMLIMDRRHATPRKHPVFNLPTTSRKPHLHREVIKPLTASDNRSDSPRHALTAKCVTFNVGAIRGKNAA